MRKKYFIALLFLLVLAKWLTHKPTVVLVPALFRFKEAHDWMRDYKTVIYRKPEDIPNKAHEAAFYFKYLIEKYNALPDAILFVQDDTGPDTIARIKCLKTNKDWGWSPLNQPQAFFKDRALKEYWRDDLMTKCWFRLARDFGFDLPENPIVSTYCCSEFAVTRSRVRQYSHQQYKDAFFTLMESSECNAGSELGRGAWAVEHLQHVIFGLQPLQMAALNNTEWCRRFKADCPESNCV
jgi:hypothetical protein